MGRKTGYFCALFTIFDNDYDDTGFFLIKKSFESIYICVYPDMLIPSFFLFVIIFFSCVCMQVHGQVHILASLLILSSLKNGIKKKSVDQC